MAERKTIAWNSPDVYSIYGRQFGQNGSGVDLTNQGIPILYSLGDSGVTKNELGADWQFTHGVADSANPNTFYGGPARGVTKGSDLTRQMIERGMLTPQQVVEYMNQSAAGIDAALNPDGSISYTNIDHSNDFDFGNVLLGGLAAGLGAYSGGFGLGELFGGLGGGSGAAAAGGGDLGLFNAGVGGSGAIGGSGAAAGAAGGGSAVLNGQSSNLFGGATGNNGMFLEDWISQIAQNPGAVLPEATSSVDGIINSLVTNGTGQFASSGIPWADSLVDSVIKGGGTAANATSVLDTLKKLIPSGNLTGSGSLAGLGALAGLLGGSKQAGTITSVNDIPDWLKPAAAGLVANAGSMFDQTNQPNPLLPAAQAEIGKTISGQYLTPDSNPFLKGTVDDALGQVKSQLNSQFKGADFGSSAHQEWLGRGLANTALPFYNQNYQQERNRQFGAATAAPDYTQSVTASRFAPLNQYAGLLKGWGSQTSQPYFENKLGNAFGGAMTGYSLGQLFGR